MPESLSEQNIDEILKEIGYNDSPLRREVKRAFAKYLQQKPVNHIAAAQFREEILEELDK